MNAKPLRVIAGTPDKPLTIGDIEIPCYVLEDETRVLTQNSLFDAFAARRGGHFSRGFGTCAEKEASKTANPKSDQETDPFRADLPRFLTGKWVRPFISDELVHALRFPILIEIRPNSEAYGYPATILVDVCDAILSSHFEGNTTQRQMKYVERARILTNGFATIGIIGLIDEATGYQHLREERALAAILEKYITKKLQPWTKTFPYEFYAQIFRLKEWDGPNGVKRPSVIGHYTNDLVYTRLAPGVLDILKQKNPVLPSGNRGARHHQWFTRDHGIPELREHLAGVIALMKASRDWYMFMHHMNRVYPKYGTSIPFDFIFEE